MRVRPASKKPAYNGPTETIRKAAPYAQDFTNKKGDRHHPLTADQRAKNRSKSNVRARGEHPLLVLKCIFGLRKVRLSHVETPETARKTRNPDKIGTEKNG